MAKFQVPFKILVSLESSSTGVMIAVTANEELWAVCGACKDTYLTWNWRDSKTGFWECSSERDGCGTRYPHPKAAVTSSVLRLAYRHPLTNEWVSDWIGADATVNYHK